MALNLMFLCFATSKYLQNISLLYLVRLPANQSLSEFGPILDSHPEVPQSAVMSMSLQISEKQRIVEMASLSKTLDCVQCVQDM